MRFDLEGVIALLIPFGFFAMVAVIVWLGTRMAQFRIQQQAETQKRLLDKFQSGRELAEFIETESGRRFIEQLGSGRVDRNAGVLRSLRAGIVVSFFGLAFVALSMLGLAPQRGIVPGVLLLGVGLGLIIAAGVSRYLSRKWSVPEDAGSRPAGSESFP